MKNLEPSVANRKKFDLDLAYGKVREQKVAEMLTDKKIEVKSERDLWTKTGNIAIEYKFRNKPSGISTTEAKWWCVVLTNKTNPRKSDAILVVEVIKLREHLKAMFHQLRRVNGGFKNASRLLLVPVGRFLPITMKH